MPFGKRRSANNQSVKLTRLWLRVWLSPPAGPGGFRYVCRSKPIAPTRRSIRTDATRASSNELAELGMKPFDAPRPAPAWTRNFPGLGSYRYIGTWQAGGYRGGFRQSAREHRS